jgi:hypothetical protein
MQKDELDRLRFELSVKAKNGIDFIIAATIVWSVITCIWLTQYSHYNKSVLTFIAGGPMLPLAFLFSKIFKTTWTLKHNPLNGLGLWLNFAQLFYFPILVFTLIRMPEHFVLMYVIITGAHFFPYAWYYNTKAYAVMAGVIAIGSMIISLSISEQQLYFIPFFMVMSLAILAIWVYSDSHTKMKSFTASL